MTQKQSCPPVKTFYFVNRHPEGIRERSCAASAVNAIAIITGETWMTVFGKLLEQAHNLCLMPEDDRCVRDMLSACGFVRQPNSFGKDCTPEFLREYLQTDSMGGARAIVQVPHGGYGGYMLAVLPDADGNYVMAGCDPRPYSCAEDVWLYWPDGVNRSPAVRQTRTVTATGRQYPIPKNHVEFEFRQENPGNNFIGDCVVRGIASACGITWHEAVDQLGSHGYTAINNHIAYRRVLADNGFIKQKPLRIGGRNLTGVEFCEEVSRICRKGEAIFVHVGRSHVAAALPVRLPSGAYSYRILDNWDSTSRAITDWWMQPVENRPKRPEKAKPTSVSAGDRVQHPSFGTGTVQSVTGTGVQQIVEIRFDGGAVKKLGSRWVLENCTVDNAQ